jgi:hypothetical protein
MRRKSIWLSVLALASFAGSATAVPITTDGNFTDWFSYGGNLTFNTWNEAAVTLTSVNIRTVNDEEGPTPGGGGQAYDNEQIFYYYDDADPNNLTGGTLHIGMVTGYNPDGLLNGLEAGDLFLDLGNTGTYNLAIAVAPNEARYESAWVNTGAPNWTTTSVNPPFSPQSDPYRLDETQAGAAAFGGNVDVAWALHGGKHWFMEVTIDIDAALEDVLTNQNGGLGLHWTMECGNDVIEFRDDNPFVPVPEPSTMILLGMGVLGVALRARRPSC